MFSALKCYYFALLFYSTFLPVNSYGIFQYYSRRIKSYVSPLNTSQNMILTVFRLLFRKQIFKRNINNCFNFSLLKFPATKYLKSYSAVMFEVNHGSQIPVTTRRFVLQTLQCSYQSPYAVNYTAQWVMEVHCTCEIRSLNPHVVVRICNP